MRQQNTIEVIERGVSIARGGFIYRGATLFNSLPLDLRSETRIAAFKRKAKRWIVDTINVKPP